MDQQEENRNCIKPLTLSATTALEAARHHQQYHRQVKQDWPAFDKPPDFYASQNNRNVKMISQPASQDQRRQQQQQQQQQHNSLLDSIQQKLFTVLYIYAILIVSLYLTYAAYYFLQQHQKQQTLQGGVKRQATAQELRASDLFSTNGMPPDNSLISEQQANNAISTQHEQSAQESQLETKLHLLERYMELIANDLQKTKERLREREKCDCSVSCHFNGTRYEDRSSWQNKCDICSCQMGKISCQPRKCPPIQCDEFVTLPGQCCPICMRQCKYNKMLIRHGEKFDPTSKTVSATRNSTKICQCFDGRIKCEPAAVTRLTSHKTTAGSNGLLQSAISRSDPSRQVLALEAARQATAANNGNSSIDKREGNQITATDPSQRNFVPSTSARPAR